MDPPGTAALMQNQDEDGRHGSTPPREVYFEPNGILEALMAQQKERFDRSKRRGQIQHKLHLFLEFGSVRKFLNIILLLDIVLVVVNMILEIQYLESVKHDFEHHFLHRTPSEGCNEVVDVSAFGSETLLDTMLALTCVSAAILGLFIVENVLHMVSVGLWGYLTDPLMVLDITVVTLAFGFEVHELEQLHSKEDPGGSSAAGVLIFARVWRFAQFGHGVFLMQHGHTDTADKKGHADPDHDSSIDDPDTRHTANRDDVSYASGGGDDVSYAAMAH